MRNIFSILIFIFMISITINGKTDIVHIDSAEEQLIYPGKILEGPDRNIYIYDSQDAYIKIFSAEGKFIRKIVGKGEGPGQAKRADLLDFGFTPDGKQLYFTEYFRGHDWITYLSLEGKLDKTVKYQIKGFYGILRAVPHRNGSIYIQKETFGEEILRKEIYYSRYFSEILTMDSTGAVKTSVLKLEHSDRISFIRGGGDMGIPFTPKFLWAVNESGDTLFTDGTDNKLKLYSNDGSLLKTITLPVPEPELVTKTDLDQWRKRLKDFYSNRNRSWYKRFGSVIEKYTKSIFKFKPAILGFQITPGGNLLIKCSSVEDNRFRFILADIKGNLITANESPYRKVKISKNYIFFLEIDEDEEQVISFLNRSDLEKVDLERVLRSRH